MPIKQYQDPQDAILDAKLICCPRCWQTENQAVRVGKPFVTPEGLTLRALIHRCAWCLDETETYYVGRPDGVLKSGTWLDWEREGQTVGRLAEIRYIRRQRGR